MIAVGPSGRAGGWWPWAAAGTALALAPALRATLVGPVIGMGLLLVLGVGLAVVWSRGDRGVLLLLLAALGLRLSFLALDASLEVFPKADAIGYHDNAAMLADAWWRGQTWAVEMTPSVSTYVHAIAPLYFFFGPNPLLPRLLSAVLGMAAVYNVFRIGERFLPRRAALAGSALVALLPSLAQLQSENLRDPLIILLVTIVFRLLLSRRLSHPAAFTGLGATLLLIFFLREPTVLALALPVLVLAVHRLRSPSESSARSSLAPWIGGAAVAVLLAFAISRLVAPEWTDPALIEATRANWAEGGSAYLRNVQFDSWGDVLLFVPVGALYFFLSPFPWQIHNSLALLAAVENLLIFYPATALAAAAAWRNRTRPEILALALFALVGVALFGIIEGNVGTALRHRAQFTWIVLLLAGPSLAAGLSRPLERSAPAPAGGDPA